MIDYTKFHEYEIRDDNGNVVIPGEYTKETYFMNRWTNAPGQIDYIAANLHFLNESLKTLKGEVSYDELKNNIADMTVSLDNRMTALDDKINSLSGSGGVTEDTDLSVALTQLRNEFEEFKRTTNSSISNFDTIYGSKIDNLTDKVNTSNTNNESRIDAAIDAVNSQINSALNEEETGTLQVLLAQSVELLTQKINALQEEIDGLDAVYERKFTNMKLEIMQTVGDELGAAQIRNDEALEDLNFRIDKFSKETEQKLADFSSDFDTKSTELQNRMDSEFSNLNNKYEIIYNDAKTSVENLDSTLTEYKADINTKLEDLKTYAEDSYNELVAKTDNMTSEVRQAIDLTKSEVEDYMDTQLGHEGSDHTVTQEESEDPTSIYYGIPAGTVVVGESTGMFKVIDDTKSALQGEIDQAKTDVEGKLSETSQELHTQITDMSTDLSNQIDTMDKQYTENISQMGDTLSGRIDTAESTLNQKIEDLTNRVKDTNANASTIQGILSVAMSGQDNVAEVHTRGNSLQLIAGQNNVETIAPYSSSSIEGGRFYTFKLVPNKTYAIATRVKDIEKSNYVTDSIGTSYTGDNNILVTEEGQYPLGYILGDYVTVKDSVVGVVSYNEEILPDSQMVAVIDVTELSNAYISQINMGNGVISLDGKLINITGETVFNDDAIIKGTMTTGKVEIGDSGVKLDKEGLSIALDNGSTIKYDSTGQHFVDSIGNSFAGIGRFMIGNCSDGKRITFKNPWDVVPNIIMIPMQYTLARAAGTDYEADAMINCYPTNIDRYGFDPVVYTAITSYNYDLDGQKNETGDHKSFTNNNSDYQSSNFVSASLTFPKNDDISNSFKALLTPRFRGITYRDPRGGYVAYRKNFPNRLITLKMTEEDTESIICAINKGYTLKSDIFGMNYFFNIIKKNLEKGYTYFPLSTNYRSDKGTEYTLNMLRFMDNGDIYLITGITETELKEKYWKVFNQIGGASTHFPNTKYVVFTFPKEGIKAPYGIKIGNFIDLDPDFDYADYYDGKYANKETALFDKMKHLRGNGNFTPIKMYRYDKGMDYFTDWCSWKYEDLGIDGSTLMWGTSYWHEEWHSDVLKIDTYVYGTTSTIILCRADYEDYTVVPTLSSPSIIEFEEEAGEAIDKNCPDLEWEFYAGNYSANSNVNHINYPRLYRKLKPTNIFLDLSQFNPEGNYISGGSRIKVPQYVSSDISTYDGHSTMVELEMPHPSEIGTVKLTYFVYYDETDESLQDNVVEEPTLDYSIPMTAIDMTETHSTYSSSDHRYGVGYRSGNYTQVKTKPKIEVYYNGAKISDFSIPEATLKYDTTDQGFYKYCAVVTKEPTVIELDLDSVGMEYVTLLCENEAGRKSGSAVFIATDASSGEYLSGNEEAELDIKIAEAQRENDALSLEKATAEGQYSALAEHEANLTNDIAALNEENSALNSRISNFDVDYSSIEARLDTLLGVHE